MAISFVGPSPRQKIRAEMEAEYLAEEASKCLLRRKVEDFLFTWFGYVS